MNSTSSLSSTQTGAAATDPSIQSYVETVVLSISIELEMKDQQLQLPLHVLLNAGVVCIVDRTRSIHSIGHNRDWMQAAL